MVGMEWVYGRGEYFEEFKHFKGEIVRDENKLFLREPAGDIVATFVPLEKVERIKKTFRGVEIFVRLSAASQYCIRLRGERKKIGKLIVDLVQKLGLKKKFLKREWIGEVFWRF